MKRGAKGRRLEYRSRRYLESQGYRVIRSARSLGPFDLVGFRRDQIVLVQVKANKWPTAAEAAQMRDFPAPPVVRIMVHRWDDYAREPTVRIYQDVGSRPAPGSLPGRPRVPARRDEVKPEAEGDE